MDGWMDGWMDWMDGWMDGWIDRWMTGNPKCSEEYLYQTDGFPVEWILMKFSIR
jgi:hypothetical protein